MNNELDGSFANVSTGKRFQLQREVQEENIMVLNDSFRLLTK